jgi:CelD/BcsL family acetyltransferase involved in cellulose biosynthesis
LLKTLLATTLAEVQSLRPAWESLYQAYAHTLFQSFSWNHLAAQAFPSIGLCVAYAESDNGAALIPAVMARTQLCFLGNPLFDYCDVLGSGEESVLRHTWGQLAKLGMPLSLKAVRGPSRLRAWGRLGFELQPFASAPGVLQAGTSSEEFAARHVRSAGSYRRLLRAGTVLRCYSGTASALVREIYEHKAKHAPASRESLFADPARVDFMVAAAALNSADCEIFTLECGVCRVATLVTFLDGGIRRFYTVDYDREWASQSPGVALIFEVTRRSLAAGLDCDYMTGEQPYKMRFATTSEPLFAVEASSGELRRISEMRYAA